MDVATQNACLEGWQHGQLYAGGEAPGVCHVVGEAYGAAVCFGESVDVVVCASNAEVLCQVNNLYSRGYVVLLEEGCTLAVAEAEKHDVNVAEWHVGTEFQVCFAHEAFVDVCNVVAGIALAVGKHDFCLWVV